MTTKQEQTLCKGNSSEGVHLFIFTSFDYPNQCYYCGHLEETI